MDERHWWIAIKIQESFKLGNNDNPTHLEEFMCEENTLNKVNKFLRAGGPCRLFFYCEKSDAAEVTTREIHCTGNLAMLKDVQLEKVTILYFLRNNVEKDVDLVKMERDIYCGELKHNTIETLNSLLSDIYIPLTRAQKNWGQCDEEGQTSLMHSMDKFVTALNETAASMSHSRQWILKQPENVVLNDFKQQRAAALDSNLIGQYEELVSDWMSTIDSILSDSSDERFLDPNAGPLSEVERWKRRQRLLTSVTEQLKSKECKAVLAVLITAKSRLLKRWKMIDANITDSMNDTKDKVKYLDSLKRYFDQMYHDATPANLIAHVIPGFIGTIKQMESVSRFYARTGYLGTLLTKVTNQLVQACKDYIQLHTYNIIEDRDELWQKVAQDISTMDLSTADAVAKGGSKQQGESKLKFGKIKGRDIYNTGLEEESLYTRLRSCLQIQTVFRESIHSLRETLGVNQSHSHPSSLSSFSTATSPHKRRSSLAVSKGSQPLTPKKSLEVAVHAAPLADEDVIMAHLDLFCGRIRQAVEVIQTLNQFTNLSNSIVGIPRPKREELVIEEVQEPFYKKKKPKDPLPDMLEKEKISSEEDNDLLKNQDTDQSLQAIVEGDEQAKSESLEDDAGVSEVAASKPVKHSIESEENKKKSLTEEELAILKIHYPYPEDDHEEVEGPNVSSIVQLYVSKMNAAMRNYISTKTMLDVESKDKEKFDVCYSTFQSAVQSLEKFIAAYLHVIFMRKLKTQQGLDILTKFAPVVTRITLKGAIAEKYVDIFSVYEKDLDEVQSIYEKYKTKPTLMRNAPPVAGAIYWSRQLLKRIEDPMKIFRDIKSVTSLADYGRQVRIYNKLATALVTFESLWFTQWKNNIEQARSGLRATLFVLHPETGDIVVNADERILELIHEAKWMTRLDIQIPESAFSVVQQEARFKGYKSHLELVLREFREVCQAMPDSLVKLFKPHILHVHQQLQPGLNSLAWNSMNIDAFLHQVHSALDKLKLLNEKVNQVMNEDILTMISNIENLCLFDTETAFSKTWQVEEFSIQMKDSIKEKSVLLKRYVETVLNGLQSIANFLTAKKQPDTKFLLKDKKLQLMLNETDHEKEKLEAAVEHANVLEFIGYFEEKVYNAVLAATRSTLACLADSAGCTGEIVRAFTPTSNIDSESDSSSPSPRQHHGHYFSSPEPSRAASAQSGGRQSQVSNRPASNITHLSELTWTHGLSPDTKTCLQFEVQVKFSIPNIIVEPTLDLVQKAITNAADAILDANADISWLKETKSASFSSRIKTDSNVQDLYCQLTAVIEDLDRPVSKHLLHFSYYNFLWKDDMHGNFSEFITADPGTVAIKREVERYVSLEKKVLSIPGILPVGPISLFSDPIKDSLHGFSIAWKTKFASVVHEEAKKNLDSAVLYRSSVRSKLEQHVQTLDQLNSVLKLLEELRDMENKIDGIYLPIELMYSKLREFELRLPREEVEEVDSLRDKWTELLELAENVRNLLLKERRGAFEQELDKQVKTFVVEVIQFRNAFDAQGPAVPGIQPSEAVSRLHDFQHRFKVYDDKRKTLDSVSKLFSIACKPFPELDKTGEELDLLSQLYGLFQKFIRFDSKFRDTLWAEVDLEGSSMEVEGYWDECLALPSKLKDWDAYNDLKSKLQMYLEVFPLLQKLASKEIRNRHWLEVMHVTHSSFQLEANIFKLCHLLDIELIKHKTEVEDICKGAGRELELEIKMRATEDEWTEQVLNFEHYKKRGPMYLDKASTERLLEQLEDAEALLATMLTSRYIGPLRDEAASWAEKLKEVAEVLELWLEVQDLWQYLEAVFSNSLAVRELPQEAKRFARIDKGWTKMMKRAFDTRNVLQCCYGGEVPKAVVLRHIQEELEICFKSLAGYLDNKRRAFPRFYFVSDPVLLAVLSHPNDLDSVKPHLKSFFSAISDVKLEKSHDRELDDSDHDTENRSVQHHRTRRTHAHGGSPRDRASSTLSALTRSTTPPKIDKRLHQVYNINPTVMQHVPSMLPSEGLVDDVINMDATAVISADGETLHLSNKVSITEGVEVWISKLRDSVGETLHKLNQAIITDCKNGSGLDDWPLKYPSQVCRTGMFYHWTAECEQAIADIKYDRKALQLALRKYTVATSKLATVLQKGSWRMPDKSMKTKHRVRLEAMITQSTYLKDILENMCHRKLRETTDFEWRRSLRCYLQPDPALVVQTVASASTERSSLGESKLVPRIWILDSHYEYGTEFYGTDPGVSPTPVTEKCFLTMSLALKQMMGSLLVGPGGVGKTETVKGLANILGNFLGLFHLSNEQDPVSLGQIIQGLAMDGCWGCLKESQTLNQIALSVLLDHVQSIFSALRSRQTYMNLGDGSEVPLRSSVGLFLSMNLSDVPNMKLPSDITEAFRVISMLQPDTAMLLRAKCAAMGFRAPAVLANRLKLLTELVKDQLPPEIQHNFSVPALMGVLKRASQKRKKEKDDKLAEKNNLKDDMSRSESQNSDPITSRINQSGVLNKVGLGGLRKSGTLNPLTVQAKQEHAMVCDIIEEVITPRLMTENQALFKSILKDCFANLPNSDGLGGKSSAKVKPVLGNVPKFEANIAELEQFLEQKAIDAGLIAHKPLITKCGLLYLLSQIYNGVIVAGPAGTGKSTCIQLMVDALCARNLSLADNSSSQSAEGMHKLLRLNPMVVDDTSLMFGYLGNNNEWVDSIFTHAIRKSNRNISTTWISLNGNLNKSWADNLNSFLAGDKVLHLKNGDKLFLSDNIMLLFETDDLANASPSTVSSCGILYLDTDVVGWQPIVKAWLDTRSQLESHVLQRAFQKTLDPIISFVSTETKPRLQLCSVGMLQSCLGLLSAMLADNIEVSGELHIERLYLFCLIWTFGGLLEVNDRKPFSDLLTTLSTALPDDDRDICVFDYYVDESGEWDPWISKMPETVSTDNHDFIGEVFVDTIDTIRIRLLMEFSAASGRNVLLVGPHGSGKSTIISDYMNSQDPQLSVCKRLVFSGASSAQQLQQFIDSNIHHRQGFVFGAKENKKLKVFIDDLNLPLPDLSGTQRCNELLRQLLDEKQLFTTEKPFEWHTVEDLSVMSAMVLSSYPSAQNRSVSERLLRHFSVFYVPVPQGDSLKSIVSGILKGNMTKGNGAELDNDLHNIIVSASCEMLTLLQNVLHQTPMEGRYHYLFTLKDITKCFQCLRRLADESKADDIMVISLWRHELNRIVRDGISRMADLHWLDDKMTSVLNETWKKDLASLHENYVTFPVDTRVYQRPLTSVAGANQIKVSLQPVEKWSDLHSCINTHLTRYNEEFGNIKLNTMLSDFVISHVVRIHRVLSFHHGGNMLLIGAIGSKLSTLCRLALHVADIPIHKIDTSKQSNFFDGLRSAIRLSGSEGKVIGLLFTARDLENPMYMDAINSILVSGEYPHLFSNDEMDGLLQAIQPAMKRESASSSDDPMKFFISKVKCNLHILICLHPGHDLVKAAVKNYPGLLIGCQVNWLCDWPQDTLLGEASYFVSKHQLTEDFEDLRESITTSLANIHSFVLRDCKQIPWAGDVSANVTMTSIKVHEKKKDQLKYSSASVPNLPYSKIILHERIRLNHRDKGKSKNEVYVGPTTYRKFMETFKYLYLCKSGERTKTVEQLKKVISTLDKTRQDAKVMKKGIKTLNEKFEGAQSNTADLLKKLTAKVTALEKLKAKVGLSKSLDAYLQLTEMDVENEEEHDFLKEEEYDDYDAEFDRMREANLKTRQVQAKDELETQKSNVEQCRANLTYARQQVFFWRGKVDRNVIEHVRAFSNPPLLVGQILEMVMVLIGKRLPSQRIVEVKDNSSKMDMSSRMSTSSSGTKMVVKKSMVKEPGDRFDKAQWKSMQQTMSDSVKFVDMLHNLSWEDGLPNDVLTAVESYLACSKEGQLGVTGEGSLLENAQEKQFQAVKQRSPSPGARTGLTIAGAKYASEDCATLVHYTIAIVEYSRLCGPLKTSIERMHELEREIEENERQQKLQEEAAEVEKPEEKEEEEEEELSEADLPRLQSELNSLQVSFDRAVVEKHSLEMELQSMNERLKSAVDFVESLKSQESKWRQEVQDNDGNELLLANCITAAATLTYCGPVNIDTRHRMGEFFMQVCEHHGLPLHKQLLFRNIELIEFLYTPLEIISLQRLQLPTTRLMLENACFVMQDASMTAWPLICDPTSRVIDWLKLYFTGKEFVEVKYHEVRSQLENCLADGTPLLVTDCDLHSLVKDKRFINTIQNCANFINGKSRFKVIVTDHEVECDPRFRLFLHTTSEPHVCPAELAACTTITFFQQSRADAEEELLDLFMAQEKSRLDNELTTLRQEKQENREIIEKIEGQMKDQLSSDIRLMNDLQVTKKLAELKKQYEETLESQDRVFAGEDSIYKARESYRQIAQRAAVCFDTSQYLREINSLYQSSFKQFVVLYQAAIAHSERSAMKAVIDRLTFSSFLTTARGLLERDRVVFALLLAVEVEDSLGNVGPGEREFVISPNFSSVVMSAMGGNSPDPHIMQTKKSFDWMSDDQFHNLQVLATHFEWFRDMFDRMPKDGRETQWRNLCESELPENVPLPDRMDDVLKAIHRLCIVRAVRNDRLLQASSNFVSCVLGKKYITDISLDLPTVLRQSSFTLPILLLFQTESELTLKIFQDFAAKKQTKFLTVVLTDNMSDEKSVKKQIHKGMTEGLWVLLHNAHNSPRLLNSLESILNEGVDPSDSNFRLWVTAHVDSANIPVRFLQNSLRLFIDSPKVMKDCLSRSMSWMEPDILRQSNRPDWPAMLHNLCYLHAAIHLRTRFGSGGWNAPHEFSQIGFRELQEAVRFAVGEFKDLLFVMAADGTMAPRTTSWTGIRFMLSEIVYGTHTTDVYDQQALSAIVEYWCTPNAVKRDFEVAKLKYKAPAAFFNPNPRLNQLIQSFDGVSQYFLEVPEACHLHPNIETLLGDDQYVFTRLNKVFDAMPVSPTLSHKLFPRPPTPFAARASKKANEIEEEFVPNTGPPIAGISSQSNNPLVVDQGVFSTASYATYKMRKDMELWEICHTMLQKVPKAYNKEYILEKVKKVGGFTPFNNFIMKELEIMYKLLNDIKISLQAIKNATESETLGDQVSQNILDVADDIYHLRIPEAWCKMSGYSAPPLTYGVGQWLVELQSRCHHFEKILTLGRDKMPAYWLGAFFNPRGLLSLVKQDSIRNYANDRAGNFELFTFQTEVTSRDKDHLRDPPQDGMFVWGIYLWGCAWEKTTGELQDLPPRAGCASLPVVHVTCWPVNEKPILQDSTRASETYQCPVYHSRLAREEVVLEMDVRKEGVPASRWALRGLAATIRPY